MMTASEDRPVIAVGHITLRVSDVASAAEFYQKIGMRPVFTKESMAILELRGGTHLLLFRAKGQPRKGAVRSFDLMVDDVASARADAGAKGLAPTELREDNLSGHQYFELADPDGHVLTIYSNHTEGRPV